MTVFSLLFSSSKMFSLFRSGKLAILCILKDTTVRCGVMPNCLALAFSFGSRSSPSRNVLTTLTVIWDLLFSAHRNSPAANPAFSSKTSKRGSVLALKQTASRSHRRQDQVARLPVRPEDMQMMPQWHASLLRPFRHSGKQG
jgi:hypothetical protein